MQFISLEYEDVWDPQLSYIRRVHLINRHPRRPIQATVAVEYDSQPGANSHTDLFRVAAGENKVIYRNILQFNSGRRIWAQIVEAMFTS